MSQPSFLRLAEVPLRDYKKLTSFDVDTLDERDAYLLALAREAYGSSVERDKFSTRLTVRRPYPI